MTSFPAIEFQHILTLGMDIEQMIQNPRSEAIYSPKNPVFLELQSIFKMNDGQSSVPFKKDAVEKRITRLIEIVHNSPQKSPKMFEMLSKINAVALAHLMGKEDLASKHHQAVLLLQSISLFECLELPEKFRTYARSRKDTDQLLLDLWAMIFSLETAPSYNRKFDTFQIRMARLLCSLEKNPDHIPWTTLERLNILQGFVMNILIPFMNKSEKGPVNLLKNIAPVSSTKKLSDSHNIIDLTKSSEPTEHKEAFKHSKENSAFLTLKNMPPPPLSRTQPISSDPAARKNISRRSKRSSVKSPASHSLKSKRLPGTKSAPLPQVLETRIEPSSNPAPQKETLPDFGATFPSLTNPLPNSLFDEAFASELSEEALERIQKQKSIK